MPMSTLMTRPTVNFNQKTYGDEKYNVLGLVQLYSRDAPWMNNTKTKSGNSGHSDWHGFKLPEINSNAPSGTGLTSTYSRRTGNENKSSPMVFYPPQLHTQRQYNLPNVGGGSSHSSLVPFATFGKPTCGYYFSRSTEQRKMRTGIPPTFGYIFVTAPL